MATGVLLAGDLLTVSRPAGGVVLLLGSATAAALFAAWLLGTWLQGGLELEALHGGYLVPTVAAGLVGADLSAQAGLPLLGRGMSGVGAFFWVLITTLLVVRFAFRTTLPDPLVPTMAVLVAPPAVAGLARRHPRSVTDGRRRCCPGRGDDRRLGSRPGQRTGRFRRRTPTATRMMPTTTTISPM